MSSVCLLTILFKFESCMTKEKFTFKANNLCLLNFIKDVAVHFNLKKLKRAFLMNCHLHKTCSVHVNHYFASFCVPVLSTCSQKMNFLTFA